MIFLTETEQDGSCPLHSACQHGDINTVNALVNSKRYGVNEPLTEVSCLF